MLEIVIGLLLLNFFRQRRIRRNKNLYQVVHTIYVRKIR